MAIALFSQANFPLDEAVQRLSQEGLIGLSLQLGAALCKAKLSPDLATGILVIPKQGIDLIGEQTTIVRRLLPEAASLILCIPEVTPSDRLLLQRCGASEIVSPRSWSAAHIVERVLGQLILSGLIQPSSLGDLRGASRQLRDLYGHIQRLAPLSETILILGETGTGKELVAREIHHHSQRPNPFLPINCAELRPELMGSELFGHERGAFTDARQARKGLFLEAERGTIFLDEIGDLDLKAQAQLLRVLEDRKIRPVGANQSLEIRARIILATHRNLSEDCAEGKFRYDLFQRIQGFTLELSPLRERKADIPLLVQHFVEEFNHEYASTLTLPPGSLDSLFRYDWSGNVRELRAIVRRAAAYADGDRLSAVFFQEAVRARQTEKPKHTVAFDPATHSWRSVLNLIQRAYFKAALAAAGGNKEKAAQLAGLSRSQFYEKLKEIESVQSES